jgi:hypothetical protein
MSKYNKWGVLGLLGGGNTTKNPTQMTSYLYKADLLRHL